MLSRTADYAIRALLVLARQPASGRSVSAEEIADAAGAPRNYMAKVLNAVAKRGFVTSARGPSGGFTLARRSDSITLSQVIDLFDDVPANDRCLLGSGPCNPAKPCAAHSGWMSVVQARRAPLVAMTIADLLAGRTIPSLSYDRTATPLATTLTN